MHVRFEIASHERYQHSHWTVACQELPFMLRTLCLSAFFFAAYTPMAAAQVIAQEVRMQLFLEKSGSFSENIVGLRKIFENVVTGGSESGEPADAVLVTLVFTGPKNTRSSDKIARDMANITVTQSAKTGPRVLLKRAYGGFQFSGDGRAYRAFLLDGATCAPLEVDVRVGRSRKTAKVDFRCDG
jgi:hypothetical protein